MAKKRFLLILGVVLLALLMVKATLAAASTALQPGSEERAVTISAQHVQFGSKDQKLAAQPIANRYTSAPPLSARDVGQAAKSLSGGGASLIENYRPPDLDDRSVLSFVDSSIGEPNLPFLADGPNMPTGSSAFDTQFVYAPMVISEGGSLRMWYSGIDRAGDVRVGLATSSEGITWTKSGSNPLFDGSEVFILEDSGNYEAWFASDDAHIYRADSGDGISWSINPATPVFSPTEQDGDWDRDYVSDPSVVKDGSGVYWMFYEGENRAWDLAQIGVATSTNGIDWQRVTSSPVIAVSSGEWDALYTLDPMVLLDGGEFKMWYSGIHKENNDWIRSIGYATSANGVDWTKYGSNPVFEGDDTGWDPDTVATPFVLKDNGYHMWYQSHGAIGYVTSTDGLYWSRFLDHPVLEPTQATFVTVNTFYDSVEAQGTPGADITITVVISGGDRYTMTGQVNEAGIFRSWDEGGDNWVDDHPDIEYGDAVTVTVDGSTAAINHIGGIDLDEFDLETETISGTLHAPFYTSPSTLTVRCEVWEEGGPSIVVDGVEADGGSFTCDFSGKWDLQVGQNVGVMYLEPDLDMVQDVFRSPWMRVNYAHDWVGGDYEAGHTVWITVADGGGDTKATAEVQTEPWTGWGTDGFETNWDSDWDPEGPDIDVGDLVTITTDDGFYRTIKVGEIYADKINPSANTISGTIQADWFAGFTTTVRCEIWEENGPQPVFVEGVDLVGGDFTCDFSSVGWDLQPGQHVAVFYLEPDGVDTVINVFVVPWMRVNYGHDWAGGEYPAGHTMAITVTHDGAFRTAAEVETKHWGGWDGDGFETDYENDWQPPQPDIQAGDLVTFASDDGYSNAIQVGEIRLDELDLVNNTISGTIHAAWFSPSTLTVRCEVWEGSGIEGIELDGVAAHGGGFFCDFNTIYNLQPGTHVAVMYIEPDDNDRVINVFQAPAPNLAVEKWAEGNGQAMAGGPVVYTIRIANYGDATAETILVTDTLPDDTSYMTDTTGVAPSVGGDQVTWTLGPLEPGYDMHFQLVLDNSADVGDDPLVNRVEAFVENDTNPDDNSAEAEVTVVDETPDLYVDKYPRPGNPVPGESFYYVINYGNQGDTASGPVWLTETLPISTSVVGWFSQNGFNLWQETVNDGEKLVLEAASLPGGWGDQILLRLLVSGEVSTGVQLTNTIYITTSLDGNGDNNWAQNTDAWTESPTWDTFLDKNLGYGKMVPDGFVGYNLHVENTGNAASETWLTDTLPEGMSAEDVKATRWFKGNTAPFPADLADGRTLAWDLGTLEPGESLNIDLEVPIPITLTTGTVFTNCAMLETDAAEEYPYNNDDCVVESVHETGANLRVLKNYQWNWEGQLNYNISFLNLGTTIFEDLGITDTMPISTEFNESWWHGFWRGVDFTDDSANGRLIWRLEELQPGWSSNIYFDLDLDGDIIGQGGLVFTNTVESPVAGDVDTTDNEAEVVAYTGPDIYVEKWLSGGELRPGELITYTIRFGNKNLWPWHSEEGYTCTLTDTLPNQVTFVSATAPWDAGQTWTPDSQAGNTLTWGWDRAWADSWWEFDVVAQIKSNVSAGEALTNHVEMYSNSPNDVEWDYSNNFFDLLETIVKIDIYLPLVMK